MAEADSTVVRDHSYQDLNVPRARFATVSLEEQLEQCYALFSLFKSRVESEADPDRALVIGLDTAMDIAGDRVPLNDLKQSLGLMDAK